MSKPIAVSGAVVVIMASLFGVGRYLAGEPTPPRVVAHSVETPPPSPPPAMLAQIRPDTIVDSPPEPAQRPPNPALAPIVTIAVVGGEEIPLRIQVIPPESHSVKDDGRSSGFFEPLADAARAGNDAAARILYEALDACRGYPKTRAEFDSAIDRARKDYAQTGGITDAGEQPMDWDVLTEHLERRYHRCEGVTDDMYQTAIDLLRKSVERGPTSAHQRFVYAHATMNADPREARAQYEILWQQGHLLALSGLQDSLSHRIAWVAVDIAYLHGPPGAMAALEASTPPSEFHDASKEAARILRNPNCCKL